MPCPSLRAVTRRLIAAVTLLVASRRIKLESGAHADALRVLASVVSLDGDAKTSWVTLTRVGKYSDPRYGEFEITRPMLLSMIDNFKAGTFGQQIFIDVAHQPSNGAAATIKELSLDGGKLRGLVEWTPYGIDAVKTKGYRYLSVEYVENFKDNEQGAKHGPVLLGAGLTIRPVVKGLDPIALSEDGHSIAIHPDLRTQLIQEQSTMWEALIKLLMSTLTGYQLAEGVRNQLVEAYKSAAKHITDEAAAKALADQFAATGKQLAESFGSTAIKLDLSGVNTGLTPDQVKQLMADERTRLETEAKTLAEKTTANVTLLRTTIDASGLAPDLKKELADAVADLVTGDMTDVQVKKLAEAQIASGSRMEARIKLAGMGWSPEGTPHITVDDSNSIKALQEAIDKRLKITGRPDAQRFRNTDGKLQDVNRRLAEETLALYDSQHARRLHDEHKRLASGDSLISDISLPAAFERTVIREALYNLVGLQLVDSGTAIFAAAVQLPYSYRDTGAAGIGQVRTYEGQAVRRAAVKQAMHESRPIPQKLAFEVSDELRYMAGNGQINWDVVSENAQNASRIIGEDLEALIFNEHLNASDQYLTTAVVSEATATANGTNKIFVLDNFPVVRPKKVYDLQGNQVGSTLYPVTVVVNSVTLAEYDGTGTQGAGTYYSMNYNLGEVSIVNQLGVLTAPTNTHTVVVSYTYTTNVYKFDTDLGSLAVDAKYDDFLYRFGLRKSVIEDSRYYMANIGIMSGTLRTQIEQARQFSANYKRPGTDLTNDGNLGVIKGVPCFKSSAPGLNMGDVRTIIGERGQVRLRMLKPWTMGAMENQKDSNGRFTGKKEAYGDQFVVVDTPTPLKAAMTSMVLYSATARVDRAS